MYNKSKLLGFVMAIMILTPSVVTLTPQVKSTSCNCELERKNLIAEKPQRLKIVSSLKDKITVIKLLENTMVKTAIDKLEENGYTMVLGRWQILKNIKGAGTSTIVTIPLINTVEQSTNEIIVILEGSQIKKIISTSIKTITNKIIYTISNEDGVTKSLIVEKGDDGRITSEFLNEKGIPIPLADDFWGCMALCMFEFIITNWWYIELCGTVLAICIAAPNPVSCGAAATCFGVSVLYCTGYCLL